MLDRLSRVIRQIIRGCGTLPYVGSHPGTSWLFVFIAMGALAGGKGGGLWGLFVGACLMTLFVVPLYLYGAYAGAQLSDKLVQEEEDKCLG